MTPLSVEIWSDVMCPWCALGYTQFAKSVSELASELDVEVRWMPFELNPDLPPEGKEQDRHLAEVYGRTPEQVAQMRAQMGATAARIGFPMRFEGEDGAPAMMWNTFEAHKLLRWALATQGGEAQTRLKLALLRAHFQDLRRIGERDVLLDIAAEHGFDRAEAAAALDDEALALATRLEERRGREMGINSVPSFVIAGKYLVSGCREPEDYAGVLRQVAGALQPSSNSD
ncbi:MAG: 2-hydroxychromene-2-carboxylate isomerase [Sphingomonadales bacterium 32-68-7]|nr:MAG: 2-hydroxychromene-2-carboxylate isomerase [Sphingomonadales bacterium 12-68-11]OYX10456.1 MAG: 2-hydroxychromene-2-carboxylate isomerase [Sphingomonadales bacterium 32-68-7]